MLPFTPFLTTAQASKDVTNPSEKAPKVVVAAAVTIPVINENILFLPPYSKTFEYTLISARPAPIPAK